MVDRLAPRLRPWLSTLVTLLGFLTATPLSASGPLPPVFEAADCPFTVPRGLARRIDCGYIRVPESWEDPGSRRIRVPIAVVRAEDGPTRKDPVIWIAGGPIPDLGRAPLAAASAVWRDRDVVLFDFRGMGAGDPVCPASGPAYARALTSRLDIAASLRERTRLAAECRQWAEAEGVDLGAYTARAIARDVVAIAGALGYEQWSIDTVSFGTVVAQHLLRLEPEGLRAAVLRSTLPLNVEAFTLNGFARAVELMGRYCAAEPACTATFPDPGGAYQAVFEQLERDPLLARVPRHDALLPTGDVHVTGTVLQRIVSDGLYARVLVAALPMLVRETARGNAHPAGVIAWLAVQPGTGLNGVNWAAQCDAVGAWALAGPPPVLARADEDYWRTELRVRCPALGVPPAPEADRQPVESAVPTLLMVGEHDPITPPAYTEAVARHLRRATVVEVAGRGHDLVGRCHEEIATAFLDDPATVPDTRCLASLTPPSFLTDVRPTRGPGRLLLAMRGGEHGLIAMLGAPVLVIGATIAIGLLAALVRRLRGRHRAPPEAIERMLRIGAMSLALFALGFVGVLGWLVTALMRDSPTTLIFGLPAAAAPLLVVPWLLLAAGLVLLALVAWSLGRTRWTRAGLLKVLVLALATLALGAMLVGVGFV